MEIRQDVRLEPKAFADILVRVPGRTSYFVEVDYGYSEGRIARSILRKYAKHQPLFEEVSKVVILVDDRVEEMSVRESLAQAIPGSWELEIWNETALRSILRAQFGASNASLSHEGLADLRMAIDGARGSYAFGEDYTNEPLDGSLLWTLGFKVQPKIFTSPVAPGSASNRSAIGSAHCSMHATRRIRGPWPKRSLR